MKQTSRILFIFISAIVIVLSLFVLTPPVSVTALSLSNGEAARLVLGQPDFTSLEFGTSKNRFRAPIDVAIDPRNGTVFVSDYANHRVLRFASIAALTSGADAVGVLGQASFTNGTSGIARNRFSFPGGITVDPSGRLWIADSGNHRVLWFDDASAKANGADADGVLGQPDFVTSIPRTTRTGMQAPRDVALDASGRLWVADSLNHRILRFDNPTSTIAGGAADGVLGQDNFVTNISGVARNRLNGPTGVHVDAAGRLWVADSFSNRVVRFDNAAAKPNGSDADGVLGQASYTTGASATSQTGFYSPIQVTVDPDGRLFVVDKNNHRVVWFNKAAEKANGAAADGVLGQADFVTGTANTNGRSASSLNSPQGIAYDSYAGVLWIADEFNNRVLQYGTPVASRTFLPVVVKDE